MRIVALHVDGFGLLRDLDVDGVGPGTTVVLGPNESGKSTLHAFLAATLFGHPRRNDARGRRRHEPLTGGHHGGWVAVEDDDGRRWVVHRSTTRTPRLRVLRPDGVERAGEDALDGLVERSLDLERYEQVHAIDLDALTGLGTLEGAALQDLLFDAATVGAGRSLRGALSAAVDARDGLWTPTATVRPLAAALAERDQARAALRSARAAAAGFAELRAARDDALERVQALAAERERLEAERALLRRVGEAWPVDQRRAAAERALATTPDVRLPDGVVDAIRSAAAEEAAAGADVDRLRRALDELGDDAGTVLDDQVVAVADELLALDARRPGHEDDVDRLRRADGAAAQAATALDAALAATGPEWDRGRVARVRTDAASRERVVVAGSALEDALREQRTATRRRDELAAVVRRRRAALDRRREARPATAPRDQVRRAEEAVAVLRSRLPAIEHAALLRDGRAAGPPAGPLRLLPRWLGWVLLAAAAFVLALATSTVGGGVPPWLFVVVVLAVCAPVGFVVGRAASSWRADRAASPASELEVLAADENLAREIGEEVDEAATLLGVPTPPTMAAVEAVAGRVAAARAAIESADRLDHELTQLREELDAEEAELARAVDEADAAAAEVASASTGWDAALDAVGLATDDPPRVVTVLHDRIVAAAHAAEALDRHRTEADDRRGAVERHRAALHDVLARAGVTDVDDPVAAVAALAVRVRRHGAERTDLATAGGRRAELRSELAHATARRDDARARRDEGLAAVGAADLADLDRLADLDAARREAEASRRAADAQLADLLGSGDRAATARELLAERDPIAWEASAAALASRLEALEDERDEQLRRHARLATEVEELGGDDAVPRAAQTLAGAQAAVDRLASDWVVADGAVRLLEQAIERFERDQHPRVLVAASELLADATLGAWGRLRQLDRVLVVSRPGGDDPVPVDELSRGTQEQVYLSLRLALALDRTAVEGRSLPLLVDDLLGTTDPERARAVARILAEVARQQQVWLFTCDPRTAALVTAVDPSAAVLRLRRGGASDGWVPRGDGTSAPAPPPPAEPPA